MTIEEKVKTLVNQICNEAIIYNGNPDKDSYTQAILELMRPMGRALKHLVIKVRDYADIGNKRFNRDEDEFWAMCGANDEADAILAEWGKGQTL